MIPTNIADNTVDACSATVPGFFCNRTFGHGVNNEDANQNTIFSDGVAGTRTIQWHTTDAITLYGVNLFASLDWNNGDPIGRAFTDFSLKYSTDAGGTWNTIMDFNTGVALNNQGAYTVDLSLFNARGMAAGFTFDPVTASYYKAEFTQFNTSGARVNELDAITSPAPLPGGLLLLGTGLVPLLALRKKLKA